jgi:hypothetical protein
MQLAMPADMAPPANPSRPYLRVKAGGAEAYMALAYQDAQADGTRQEVWYSATGEVVRLNNGRLAGTTGMPRDWRQIRYETRVEWFANTATPQRYVRWHDEMPGYRMNVREELQLQRIAPPADVHLVDVAPVLLAWFEERVLQSTSVERLPPARYGVLGNVVVYGEQCFAPDFCVSWQRWPLPYVPPVATAGAGQ